jgi:hypothetical protein
MAVPDALSYLLSGVITYTRHSEYEPVAPFYDEAQGVWIDCFKSDWIDTVTIENHLAKGKAVALVSPELHHRPYHDVWSAWTAISHDTVYLCTDFPDKADQIFNSKS